MLYGVASDISRRGQRNHFLLLRIELACAILAAILVDTSAPVEGLIRRVVNVPDAVSVRLVLIVLGALALIVALAVQIVKLSGKTHAEEEWFAGRAVAESTKTSAWRYMMRALPFGDAGNSDADLSAKLREVLQLSPVVQSRVAEPEPTVTPFMRAAREDDWQGRRDLYLRDRLDDQIAWYDGRARYNERRSRLYTWVSIGLQILAIGAVGYLIGVVLEAHLASLQPGAHAAESHELDLVPILTTMAAAVVAWAQAKQHDDLQNSYRQAWRELRQIRDRMTDPQRNTEADFQQAVGSAEGAISREHTMWVAKTSSLFLPEARWA